MTNISIPTPEIIIKDAQAMENIHWEDCILLLKLGAREIQWGLYKKETRYFIRLCSYVFEGNADDQEFLGRLNAIFTENDIRIDRCSEVRVLMDTPFYTVVPEAFFDEKMKAQYFTALYGDMVGLDVSVDNMESSEMRLIFGLRTDLMAYLKAKFDRVSVMHTQSLLINNMDQHLVKGSVVYLDLSPSSIALSVFSDEEPLLFQTYNTPENLDIIYHLLNAKKTLGLADNAILYLCGNDKNEALIREKAGAGFEEIYWLDRPKGGLYPKEMDEFPSHYFYHLLSLALCESSVENLEEGE
ncbi:MAG TPA: DUF3822 family protein [Chitinophagaceae bacterium]|nr:DUF3822 family protein [Chitinophagaceae bacterium]